MTTKVSYSQLGQFDRCEFAWHISHELKYRPRVTKDYLAIGTMVHEMLKLHYRGELDIEAYTKEILTNGDPDIMGEDIGNVLRAGQIVEQYVGYYRDSDWTIKHAEYHFEVPLRTPSGNEYILEGYVDLIVEIAGKLWVIEHKTSQNAKFWSETEVMLDGQTPTYVGALRTQGLDIFGIIFNFANTYEYKRGNDDMEKIFKRMRTYRTPVELNDFLYHTGLLVDRLISTKQTDIRRKSLRRDCDRCRFNEPCLAESKGIPLKDMLEAGDFVIAERK